MKNKSLNCIAASSRALVSSRLLCATLFLFLVVPLRSASASGPSGAVTVTNTMAYVVESSGGLVCYDVADPRHAVPIGQFDWNPGGFHSSPFLLLIGNTAFVGDYASGLYSVDISDPPNLVQRGFLPGNFQASAQEGSHLFAAAFANHMQIIDVSDPGVPVIVGAASTADVYAVAVSNHVAYLACAQSGLEVFNVADPEHPLFLGACTSYSTNRAATAVAVAGHIAILVDNTEGTAQGLQVIDVSSPTTPVHVCTYRSSLAYNTIHSVHLAGNIAYLGGYDGLELVDLSNPALPTQVGFVHRYDPSGWARSVTVVSNRAYVASADGLVILDVGNPSQPLYLGPFIELSQPWTRIPNPPSDPEFCTAITSISETNFVLASTQAHWPALWELSLSGETGTYRSLPLSTALVESCYYGTDAFTSLATVKTGSTYRAVAGSWRTISLVDLANSTNVLQPVFDWCWDPSSVQRISGSRIGFGIGFNGARSGANGVDITTSANVFFGNMQSFTNWTPTNGITLYYDKATGQPVAIADSRGVAWSDDIQWQFGSQHYTTNAGATWIVYGTNGVGNPLSFAVGQVDAFGSRMIGLSAGRLYIGHVGGMMRELPLPADVRWFRIDHAFGRVFLGSTDAIYFAPVALLDPHNVRIGLDAGRIVIGADNLAAAGICTVQMSPSLLGNNWSNVASLSVADLQAGYAITNAGRFSNLFFRVLQAP